MKKGDLMSGQLASRKRAAVFTWMAKICTIPDPRPPGSVLLSAHVFLGRMVKIYVIPESRPVGSVLLSARAPPWQNVIPETGLQEACCYLHVPRGEGSYIPHHPRGECPLHILPRPLAVCNTWAPASRKRAAICTCPSLAVCNTNTWAPASRKRAAICTCPSLAAWWRLVHPSPSSWWMSAPYSGEKKVLFWSHIG